MMDDKYVAYVGTYTHGSSKGIHIYDINVEEGTMEWKTTVAVKNSSHICRSKNGKYLYSIVDEGVAVFSILPDGDLMLINRVDIDGMRGCYLSVDQTGKYLYVAGYHDGKVTVVHTHSDGRLGSVIDGVYHRGIGSVAERNFRPHVSCVLPTPDNKYLCAVDSGIDQVKLYKMNRYKLELVDILRCKRDSGPRKIKFSLDGRFAYVISELSNTIDVYTYKDGEKGPEFEKIQTVCPTTDAKDKSHYAASGMIISADGKHLFASSAGDNTVSMFNVDTETGLLTKEFTLPISGEYPKDISLFPDGKHIAVVNHESNSITTFAIDYEKKVIVMKGKPMHLETPNSILITKMGEY